MATSIITDFKPVEQNIITDFQPIEEPSLMKEVVTPSLRGAGGYLANLALIPAHGFSQLEEIITGKPSQIVQPQSLLESMGLIPKTKEEQRVLELANKPFEWLGKGTEWIGKKHEAISRMPYTEPATKTMLDLISLGLLTKRIGGKPTGIPPVAERIIPTERPTIPPDISTFKPVTEAKPPIPPIAEQPIGEVKVAPTPKQPLIAEGDIAGIPPRPLVNPKASALKRDAQLRTQQRWDKQYGEAAIEKGLLPEGATVDDLLQATEQEIRNKFEGERGSISTRPTEPTPNYSQVTPAEQPTVSAVGNMYAATRKAIEDRHKITWNKIRDTFTRTITDVSGNAKRSLVEKAGEEGRQAVMDRDLIAGAGGKAGQVIEVTHNSIYSGLSNRNNHLLNEYIQSRRTIEIDSYREGMKHPGGLTGTDHQAYLSNFENIHGLKPEQMADIKNRADAYFATMKGQLRELYDNGIINEESYNNLSKYDYSKREFMQYLDPENTFNIGGRKINVTESGIKPLKEGSFELLENNSERLLNEVVSRTQSRIFKNRANNSLYDTATIHEEGWEKPANYVPENGLVSIESFKDSVELSMFKNGNRHTFNVEKNLAKDWVTSDPLINHTLSEVLQYASGAKILKAGATGYNPFFALTNLPRDIALIWTSAEGKTAGYSATLPIYLGQLGRDLGTVAGDVFKGKGRIKDFANEGGEMTFLTHYGKFKGQGVLTEKISSLSDLMSWVGEKSELWTRLALRERALRSGLSPKEATYLARNYLDFSQGGSFIKAVDTVLPYTNATVQGTRTIFRGAKTNPARFTFQMAQLGTLAMGIYFANQTNKECWDSVSDRDKSSSFIITTPFEYTDNQGQKRHLYFKIAKDQGQRIITSIFENLASLYHTGKFSAEQVKMAIADFTNLGITNFLPPTAKAFFSYALNKDFWTKLDVWRGPKGIEPKEEYTTRTEPLFVGAGKVTGLSPERLGTAVGSVIPLNNPFVSLAMGGLKAITGQLSEEMKDKSMLQMFTDNPSIRRVLSTTNPYTPHKEEMEEAKTEEATRRYKIDRIFDDLLEKYMKQKTVENYNNFMRLVNKQSEIDQDRLLQRAKRRVEYFNIPDKTWWFKLSELPPETRAEVFWKRYSNAKLSEQKQLYEIGQDLPGISSDRFLERLSELSTTGITK